MHLLTLAYLAGYLIAIQFGSDLNDPMIWAVFGLGVLTRRLHLAGHPAGGARGARARLPDLSRARRLSNVKCG